jgi:hypothetical protein
MGDEEAIAAAVEAGTDDIAVPAALIDDPEKNASVDKNLTQRLLEMTVSQKIKLALRGNREIRMLLIRDSNRLIRRFVLQNPRVGDEEIIAICKNRSADDELLRIIADSREWTKNYQVRLSLVTNPKTPLTLSMRFINGLQDRDIRALAKSKNVPSTVANQAKRVVASKPGN